MRSVNMLDLASEYELFAEEVEKTAVEVLRSQRFIGGPAIAELEETLANRVGASRAIAVSSGTDALLCSLMSLGIGPEDEVILPAFTFFATAGAVSRVGAIPVYADIDPQTFNLTPAAVEAAVTPRTKAIIPVHLFGQCADMDAINEIAAQHKLAVIEDAAQALGATYRARPACSLGTIACVSFYPTKNLGGFGEGGMIFCNDSELAQRVTQMRNHGETKRYHHQFVGGNFRLDTMKAAILLVKLKHWEGFNGRRQDNAAQYDKLLADLPVATPVVEPGCDHVYHQYSILTDRRDELQAHLKEAGVGSAIYYPVPLHLQPCFSHLGYRAGSLPVTEEIASRILSLPVHPMLTQEDLEYVASTIRQFVTGG
jgi:dTDP-4-amino-4,6-dideoxygalactose transaminase